VVDLCNVRDELGGRMDSLSLFCADDLFSPWRPHPANPVLIDAAGARQGGQFHLQDGRLWRPVQDCRHGYGRALGLAEVTTLNEQDYAQVIRTALRPNPAWPGRRIHTLTRFGRLECIHGSRNSPKSGATWLAKRISGCRLTIAIKIRIPHVIAHHAASQNGAGIPQ